uniref:Uncharacterized protein n=1 Tax=Eucampia antarctica TaxID=49252 RepID=A0A7S2RZ23_9STRA|mmetsp:Transcript_28743/g.27664  ORF Transcript_28743/g.27664 Transcript_28743/m.27664 type:complete len:101 (+) Transcript_28743:71-373(+)|eukprot:CAMPEP_0197838414 /NCGR_PEP_ID=MMETSP1437-20131217/36215_1 /TAXON_ID=49252 ORGANISM="Eucampia antarctica, Strain CCMP1452" /NCGR_SAMPLE_ID=MMETSP1437 /ASSEMBLY_ACC=CAM_ASM_001096 /LENGTH=100 /DNA_ID=CAMNT_0043446319 /DNA_START=29 /DNA_END=331 /DNA_ORIENTATION=-
MSATEEIEKRVEALELSKHFNVTKAAVQEVEMEMLLKLREIRQTMISTTSPSASNKELEALKMENNKLKLQNAKQAYRVGHLVRSVQELQSQLNKGQETQ